MDHISNNLTNMKTAKLIKNIVTLDSHLKRKKM